MSIETRFKEKNNIIQQQVKIEIDRIKKGQSKKNYDQLHFILEELEKMMNNKCLPIYYPRMIVDSWDFNDKLGLELLDLAELYKRWI